MRPRRRPRRRTADDDTFVEIPEGGEEEGEAEEEDTKVQVVNAPPVIWVQSPTLQIALQGFKVLEGKKGPPLQVCL